MNFWIEVHHRCMGTKWVPLITTKTNIILERQTSDILLTDYTKSLGGSYGITV